MFDTGVYTSLTTVDLFLEMMQDLALVAVDKAVHLRNLYQLTQVSYENIRAYGARVTATADMCGMTMKCSCGIVNSYRDLVVHQLVIHDMRDQEIRQRLPSRNTSGDLTTLAKLVDLDYIAAEEAGASESSELHTGHAMVGVSIGSQSFRETNPNVRGEAQKPYLSLNCCIDLGIIPASFHDVGVFCQPCQSAGECKFRSQPAFRIKVPWRNTK